MTFWQALGELYRKEVNSGLFPGILPQHLVIHEFQRKSLSFYLTILKDFPFQGSQRFWSPQTSHTQQGTLRVVYMLVGRPALTLLFHS